MDGTTAFGGGNGNGDGDGDDDDEEEKNELATTFLLIGDGKTTSDLTTPLLADNNKTALNAAVVVAEKKNDVAVVTTEMSVVAQNNNKKKSDLTTTRRVVNNNNKKKGSGLSTTDLGTTHRSSDERRSELLTRRRENKKNLWNIVAGKSFRTMNNNNNNNNHSTNHNNNHDSSNSTTTTNQDGSYCNPILDEVHFTKNNDYNGTKSANTTTISDELEWNMTLFDYGSIPIRKRTTLPDPDWFHHHNHHHQKNSYKNSTKSSLVVFVLTARNHFNERIAIRETWCKGYACLFVIGGKPPNEQDQCKIQNKLQNEQELYQDLLDVIHPESYHSLTYKLYYCYQWTIQHLPFVKWIMKTDDDMLLRIQPLEKYVLNRLDSNQMFYIGRFIFNVPVLREGKWAEKDTYPKSVYPPYAEGNNGHILSRPIVEYLASMEQNSNHRVVYYSNEDSALAIWLEEATNRNSNFTVTMLSNKAYFRKQYYFKCDFWKKEKAVLSWGHRMTASRIYFCGKDKFSSVWSDEEANYLSILFWNQTLFKDNTMTKFLPIVQQVTIRNETNNNNRLSVLLNDQAYKYFGDQPW